MSAQPDVLSSVLRDSLARYLTDTVSFNSRRPRELDDRFELTTVWRGLAELGVCGLLVPEEEGGAGASLEDAVVVIEELGRVVLSLPYASSALLAPLVSGFGPPDFRRELRGRIAGGGTLVAVAPSDFLLSNGSTKNIVGRVMGNGDISVSGTARMMVAADKCDELLIAVSTDDQVVDSINYAFIARDSPGISLSPYRLYDGTRASTVCFDDVRIKSCRLMRADAPARDRFCVVYALGIAAEILGIARMLLATTLEYLSVREAFGRRLSSFQVLQHRMVDLYCSLHAIESGVTLLHHASSESARATVCKLYHGALAIIGEHGRRIAKEAIQLHGAVGAMREHVAGAALPRIVTLQQFCGDNLYHVTEYARYLRHESSESPARPLF